VENGVGLLKANLRIRNTWKMGKKQHTQAHAIAFGFDRATDERSFELFLQCFVDKKLMETLLPRLQDEDIQATVDLLTGIMHKHLSEKEYHSLFLAE
jgi:hypothetical protein